MLAMITSQIFELNHKDKLDINVKQKIIHQHIVYYRVRHIDLRSNNKIHGRRQERNCSTVLLLGKRNE